MNRAVARVPWKVAFFALVLAGAGSVWQAAAPSEAAAAQSDLRYYSNATWTADPVAGRVHVLSQFVATSNATDIAGRRSFYSSLVLTLPAASTEFVAASLAGAPLPVDVRATSGSGVVVEIGLGKRLYSGQTVSVSLSFDIIDRGGSTDRDLRIGRNLVSFPVFAFGSPGTPGGTTTVVFPAGFSVQEEYGGLTRSVTSDGKVVYTSGTLDDATALAAWFTAVEPVQPGDLRTRSIALGGLRVDLVYWVDDPGWADQVEKTLRAGYPMMASLVGVGDPSAPSLTVEESSSQEIGGFSGSFEQDLGFVRVSYYADPFVILHETAHLWFNGTMATDRWIDEGFASYYAEQVVLRLGLPDHAPRLSERLMAAASPLNQWTVSGPPSSASEAYRYGASLQAAHEIADIAGQDGLRQVWTAIRSGSWAYQPLHASLPEGGRGGGIDSQGLLDYLEQTTGFNFDAVWPEWVLDPAQVSTLQRRHQARSDYQAAIAAAGNWDLPPDIRRALDSWQFDQAISFIGQVRNTLSVRTRIDDLAVSESTTVPPTFRVAFEAGLMRGSREAGDELAALQALAGARQAQTTSRGAAHAVGLLGSDPASDLVAARKAFADGDMGGASDLANRAWSEWSGATGTGQIRILGSAVGAAGLLLLLALLIWTRGSRRRSAVELADEAAAEEGGLPVRRAGGVVPTDAVAFAISGGKEPPSPDAGRAPASPAMNPAAASSGIPTGDEPASADAWAVDPSLPPLESAYDLLQRGQALLRDHHNAQAAVVLERASRLEPDKASILEALGRARYNSGQHARAAEAFDGLLQLDPSAHYGHFGLGLCLERLGRELEARTHLRMAVALDPQNASYRRALDRVEAALV